MNDDLFTEILLHLPVQYLLRFRAVCKFWYDVIDSSSFRKLHTRNNNKSDETLRENPIPSQLTVPIAICNPFLGQLKLLLPIPTTSSNLTCRVPKRSVAVGYDEDFKVVQLSRCDEHNSLHAHVYSRNTDSWRELAVDDDHVRFMLVDPIKSASESGHFVHWHTKGDKVSKILSLDIKNEVFRTIELTNPFSGRFILPGLYWCTVFAKDDHSFMSFYFNNNRVHIYETRCEGSKWSWNKVTTVEMPCIVIEIIPQWKTGFVVIENWAGATFVYDYREGKFICKLPNGALLNEYRGSLVSL
ncbi:putative F-box protein [Salvia divinorum]|uniref:F-box protein n=1 Tax=Salvia divinorum TaxID=28513 RepID=A0ABD1IHJ0_SALDI